MQNECCKTSKEREYKVLRFTVIEEQGKLHC